ncbi:hypothetical protein BH23GEM6_BH23GEM6_27900 [soil metagenome]
MRPVFDVFTGMFVAVGVVLIAVAIPLLWRRVPPNALYGLRVPATFADEWVWYEANEKSGRDLLVLGILIIVAAPVALLIPGLTPEYYAAVMTALLLMGVLIAAALGWRRANRLLRERQEGSSGTTR